MTNEEKIAALREALIDAEKRMTRARRILTDNNPRPECNWGMLDTSSVILSALAATAQSEASEGRDAWQPIESAPKDGTAILLAAGGVGIGKWVDTFKSGAAANYWMSLRLDRFMTGPVTHWMPLPSAPVAIQSTKGESDV